MRQARSAPGLERVEARFHGRAYAPHRHDTYAIGFTVAGVQCFDYRGAARHSTPGRVFVLHPDELHDGRAGGEAGFSYRILYLAPALVREALGDCALPFVREPVSDDRRLGAAAHAALSDLDDPVDDLRLTEIVASLADALKAASGERSGHASLDFSAVRRARDMLAAHCARGIDNAALEAETGLDRWALARQFRRAYGVSPHRFLMMRRLDRARALIGEGVALAAAAQAAGFADQSHMTRQFRGAYGVPPGGWQALVSRGRGS